MTKRMWNLPRFISTYAILSLTASNLVTCFFHLLLTSMATPRELSVCPEPANKWPSFVSQNSSGIVRIVSFMVTKSYWSGWISVINSCILSSLLRPRVFL